MSDEPAAVAHLVAGALPAPDWSHRLLDAHEEGWAAVGPGIEVARRREPAIWTRGSRAGGRNPRFDAPAPAPVAAHGPRARRALRACLPTTALTGFSTGGSWSDFDRDPVVDDA